MNNNIEEKIELIKELLENKQFKRLKEELNDLEPTDIAGLFEELEDQTKIPVIFRLLSKELASEVFVEMDPEKEEELIKGFTDKELKAIFDEMYVDDMADIIEEMPATVVKRILRQTDPETRKQVNEILNYPEDSAGSIMNTDFVALRADMTVKQAKEKIKQFANDIETFIIFYVTQPNKVLTGFISLKDLLFNDENTLVKDIMDDNVISVQTTDDQETVALMMADYDFMAMPVVDLEFRLVGIVTIDDAIDVMEEEVTEDIEKISAILPSEKPYFRTTVFETFKQRIPWLLLLMVSATFTGKIISSFEEQLAAQAALTAFIPMLMDTGGNSGSQASVTIIRSMSLGDVDPKDVLKVIWKEMRVSVLCGAVLSVASFVKILVVDVMLLGSTATPLVAGVVCATLFFTVCAAKMVGCTLPILAKSLKMDPAVMASPLITTIVDAISLLIFFNIATMILHI